MSRAAGFTKKQIHTVGEALELAEELVSDAYKMSPDHWRRHRYDVKTLAGLAPSEISDGHFARIVRYAGRKGASPLTSSAFDFYKICLMDHKILRALAEQRTLELFPFSLYLMCHELIHIVRFSRFLQAFYAPESLRLEEEGRVHAKTREILEGVRGSGMEPMLKYFEVNRPPVDVPSEEPMVFSRQNAPAA